MSGSKVVFQGGRTSTYDDVYVYDVEAETLNQVTFNTATGDWHDWDPRVLDERVVWEKNMLGSEAKPGIYVHDLTSGTSTLLVEGDDYRDPDIWGDYLVCVKNVASGTTTGPASEILLFNLKTKEAPKSIADSTKSNEHPRISEGRVVWSSGQPWAPGAPDPWRTHQIHLYDITAGTDVTLTNNVAGNLNPAVQGDLIAWETKQPSSIMAYDVLAQKTIQIPIQSDVAHAPDIAPFGLVWYGDKGLYTAVPPESATRFPDVPSMYVYHEGIEGMAEAEIINGFVNGDFGPQFQVTRQQFAKMIVLTRGMTATLADEYSFTDGKTILHIEGELYAYHYVARAALSGLVQGYTDGSFRPYVNISRQQVITMIVRAGSTVLEPVPDGWSGVLSYSNATHGENIRIAEYNGLLEGIVGPDDGLTGWSTTEFATRGECAQMLWNLYTMLNPQPQPQP
jgi:hypothetical protein